MVDQPPSNKRSILQWEVLGAVFIFSAGSILHFVFAWTNHWVPIALVAAVNESVWEHLKLAFWPGLAWSLLPNRWSPAGTGERVAIRGFSLLLTALIIVVVFKVYTGLLGRNLLALDIGIFALAIIVGQMLVFRLLQRSAPHRLVVSIGAGLLILQLISYSLFTYFAPDFWLFVDSRTGLSGFQF